MKNIREFESDSYGEPRRNVLVVHHDVHGGLVKANRILFCVVLLLLAVIFIVGFSLVTPNPLLSQLTNKQIIAQQSKLGLNPVLSSELNDLKSQMVGLVSGSIESKLRVLELSIQSGSVNNVDLGIISDLRNDFSVLRRFSKTKQFSEIERFSELKQLPLFASKQETTRQLQQAEQLILEMAQLKTLIYITLASCSLMFVAVAGVWLQQRYLLGYEKKLLKNSRAVGKE